MPKKVVDANRPRGPATAYTLFVRTCRDELRRKYPQLTVDYNVISRKCSERWKAMSEHERKRFNDTADIQRRRHKEEMNLYLQEQSIKQQTVTSSIVLQTPSTQFLQEAQAPTVNTLVMSNPSIKKPGKKRERKPKDPLAPKKPLSAYFLFCADERPKLQSSQTGLSVSDLAKELGARWKNALPELKSKYEQVASEKKHVYQTEMANYKHQTSSSSSPPESSQDCPNTFSLPSTQQNHPHLEQLLLQELHFNSFDQSDLSDVPHQFEMINNEPTTAGSTIDSH